MAASARIGRIDTPIAISAPSESAAARADRLARAALDVSRTVWLSEPIDLRLALDRLAVADQNASDLSVAGAAEIERQLRAPRSER